MRILNVAAVTSNSIIYFFKITFINFVTLQKAYLTPEKYATRYEFRSVSVCTGT